MIITVVLMECNILYTLHPIFIFNYSEVYTIIVCIVTVKVIVYIIIVLLAENFNYKNLKSQITINKCKTQNQGCMTLYGISENIWIHLLKPQTHALLH